MQPSISYPDSFTTICTLIHVTETRETTYCGQTHRSDGQVTDLNNFTACKLKTRYHSVWQSYLSGKWKASCLDSNLWKLPWPGWQSLHRHNQFKHNCTCLRIFLCISTQEYSSVISNECPGSMTWICMTTSGCVYSSFSLGMHFLVFKMQKCHMIVCMTRL